MIIVWFLLDLFFYNYTLISTCFFLLAFFDKNLSLFYLIIIGVIWDFFVLHTHGIFTLMLCIFYFFNKKIKGLNLSKNRIFFKFFIFSFVFLIVSLMFFGNIKLYLVGVLLNFIILLVFKI